MNRRNILLAAAAATLVPGCVNDPGPPQGGYPVPPPPARPPSGNPALLGTEWRLVHFQSSDDSIGTIRAQGEGDAFTLLLNPDGSAAMRITCNRGTGQWTSPDARASRGSLTIAGGAMTMAACPPSRLDRFATDLANVRTFVIQDGRLNLNLMMDAGNYVFVPSR